MPKGMDKATPRFAEPPLRETVFGVQFKPLAGFKVTHLGLFWERVRDELPFVEHREPLDPVVERFGESRLQSGPAWRVSTRPDIPRAWFLGESGDCGQHLLQLQRDRLLVNWRRGDDEHARYTSYEDNRETFGAWFERFLDFAREHDLGDVEPKQCEVTYVNQVVIENGIAPGEMFARCFRGYQPLGKTSFLPRVPEGVSLVRTYLMPEQRGRLHVQARTGVRRETGVDVIDLNLTARGAPGGEAVGDVLEWLDDGHEWVVRGFDAVTTPQMHRKWKKEMPE